MAADADEWPPAPQLTATHGLLCAACKEPTLSVVTVTFPTDQGTRRIGGWACCMNVDCRATPHPTMKEPDHGGS
ncbi:hypothetical protein ABT358_02440 [Streptomyces sp. NPDC000341]|uniref:hypothetical protein n=1 Tax=Streptomyces sp. NPDC000341 TaxID=3156645 RepID=UPI003330ADCB